MNKVELQELVGGALQEKFNKSFERVIENLQDLNTPFKNKREITIKLKFTQNEMRDNVTCEVDVSEKLAPQTGMQTHFSIGKNLKTGEMYAEEYGNQIKGQMSFSDVEPKQASEPEANHVMVGDDVVDADTGEIVSQDTVVDFRKAAMN